VALQIPQIFFNVKNVFCALKKMLENIGHIFLYFFTFPFVLRVFFKQVGVVP
jgi:hypothetical protein